MKECGVLVSLSTLNNKYGIGSLGRCAFELIDFLYESKQKYLQILPLGQTGFGDSPYQTFSFYAGSVYYIDLDLLVEQGLLSNNDLICNEEDKVNYEFLYNTRFDILKKAFSNFKYCDKYYEFIKNEWLEDYAIFMSLKEVYKCSWFDLPNNYKYREKDALDEFKDNYINLINFYKFTQFIFYKQWFNLKDYANLKGIKIIGDIPIYSSYDSVEVWCDSCNYLLDDNLNLTYVAGCPKDEFCESGQYWGNPLYDWDYIKKNNFKLFKDRFDFNLNMYDVIRIDHFRGYSSYFKIKCNESPLSGVWCNACGVELFNELRLDKSRVIIEDLGHISEDVINLIKHTKFDSMKVATFGLDNMSDHLPNKYNNNCVAYTTTHDNIPINGFIKTLNDIDKRFLFKYYNHNICFSMIKHLYKSKAKLVIISLFDILELDEKATLNIPNTLNNWTYKLSSDCFTESIKRKLINLVNKYNR